MVSRRPPPQQPERKLELLKSVEHARAKLDERIEMAKTFLADTVVSEERALESAKNYYYNWTEYNGQLLKTLFSTDEIETGYNFFGPGSVSINASFAERASSFYSDFKEKIRRLESIRERLEVIPMASGIPGVQASPTVTLATTNRVFVVHGHDQAVREQTARLLERLGIEPMILNEQASGGRTVVEKIEHYGDVRFAIVLLTPDDEGRKRGSDEDLKPRARQNVILELGYFLGHLKRHRVCALYRPGVELPSDYAGVVYVPLDDGGAWKFLLARELEEGGFSVDMNRLKK
jgi:predicted nucleotide-binding protein